MLYGMANNGVIIPAERDGALYNFLLGNQDYIFEGIGNEFQITPSASSFLVTLGTGEGVVCGRHVTEETVNGANSMIQLTANSSGYVTICVDLSRPAGTEAYLRETPTLAQDNLNNAGTVHDLPLYQFTTNGSGVSAFTDIRNISGGSNVVCELDGGNLYVKYYEDGAITRKQVGSLDPENLTATPADVMKGKTFGGAGTDEVQTGTYEIKSQTVSQTISIARGGGNVTAVFTFDNLTQIYGITKIQKLSGSQVITMFTGYPDPGTGTNALNIPSGGIDGNRVTQRFINNSDASNTSCVIAITAVGI